MPGTTTSRASANRPASARWAASGAMSSRSAATSSVGTLTAPGELPDVVADRGVERLQQRPPVGEPGEVPVVLGVDPAAQRRGRGCVAMATLATRVIDRLRSSAVPARSGSAAASRW